MNKFFPEWFPYDELVKLYVDRKICVSIDELEEAGLIERFLADAERLSPTKPVRFMNNHQTEYRVHKENRFRILSLMYSIRCETTFPVISENGHYELGHLEDEEIVELRKYYAQRMGKTE